MICNSVKLNKLPDSNQNINLDDRLIKFNEKEVMLNIADLPLNILMRSVRLVKLYTKTPESLRFSKRLIIKNQLIIGVKNN